LQVEFRTAPNAFAASAQPVLTASDSTALRQR